MEREVCVRCGEETRCYSMSGRVPVYDDDSDLKVPEPGLPASPLRAVTAAVCEVCMMEG